MSDVAMSGSGGSVAMDGNSGAPALAGGSEAAVAGGGSSTAMTGPSLGELLSRIGERRVRSAGRDRGPVME
jgi:hypothetical protein